MYSLNKCGLQMAIIHVKRCIKVFFLCLCVEITACNNTKHRSDEKICNDYSWILHDDWKKDSLKILEKSNEILKNKEASDRCKIIAYVGLSTVNEFRNQETIATKYAEQAITLATEKNYPVELCYAYLQMIDVVLMNRDSQKVIEYIEKLDKVIKKNKIDEPRLLSGYYLANAFLYRNIQENEKAIRYFEKAFLFAEKSNTNYNKVVSLLGLSWMYNAKKEHQKAMRYIDKAYQIAQKHLETELIYLAYEKALTYLYMNDYKNASVAIMVANKYAIKFKDNEALSELSNLSGDVYLGLNQLDKAKEYYDYAKKTITKPVPKSWLFASLAKYYAAIGDDKTSATYWHTYYEHRDSLTSIERILSVKNLEKQYDEEKKKHEVAQQRLYVTWAVLSLVVVVLSSIIYTYVFRKNSRLKIKLAESESSRIKLEIDAKERELASNILWKSRLTEQNKDIVIKLYKIAENFNCEELKKEVAKITKIINNNEQDKQDWDKFKLHFEAVSPHFFDKLLERTSSLTDLDLKHCAYIKINMSPKQVAQILGISPKSVTLFRVRLKKKLHLEESQSLSDFLREL